MVLKTAALISFGSWIFQKVTEKGLSHLIDNSLNKKVINKAFYDAVEETSDELEQKYPGVLGNSVSHFFKNDKIFEELIKMLFYDAKIDATEIESYLDKETLPDGFIEDFIDKLKTNVQKRPPINKIFSNKKIYIALIGIGSDIKQISKFSQLSHKEIKEIKNLLESLLDKKFDFQKFLKDYSETAVNNLSQVNYIGLGVDASIKRNRKKLRDIYVKPEFQIELREAKKKDSSLDIEVLKEAKSKKITYDNLFSISDKVVVLGNPGSGKSVLVKSLLCDILDDKISEFNKDVINSCLAFRIELRKYLAFKKQNSGNIVKYLANLIEEEYGIGYISDKILDELLSHQKTVIFFDGLDEIFKLKDKVSIKNDIENFHIIYKDIVSVTTSRKIGYEEAKLGDEFFELHIQNFNDEKVEEYVNKWYSVEEKNTEIREKEVSGFLNKRNEIDEELLKNPLLLSLIVILYRNLLKLPESKLEIYQSCTRTLVDKWDASKDLMLDVDIQILKNKEKILADLAYWQYEQMSGEDVEITFQEALRAVRKSIEKKLDIEDEIEAKDKANSFMSYAEKRSIYFDNNFTHKTFLEYYTAYWIYSNIEKKYKVERRDELISKYINNSFWHIVLELLLNMIDKDQADSEIIDQLLEKQLDSIKSLPFILSTIPSLKNISNDVIEYTLSISIDILIKKAYSKKDKKERESIGNFETQVFTNLRNLFHREGNFDEMIIKLLQEKENKLEEYRFELYVLFLEIYATFYFNKPKYEVTEIFDEKAYMEEIKKDLYAYRINSFFDRSGKKDLNQELKRYIKYFGPDSIFKTTAGVYENVNIAPFARKLTHFIELDDLESLEETYQIFQDEGVDFDKVLEFFRRHRITYSPGIDNDEYINKILNFLNKNLGAQLNAYLILLLNQILNVGNKKVEDYEDLLSYLSKWNELQEIFSETNYNNRVDLVFEKFQNGELDKL